MDRTHMPIQTRWLNVPTLALSASSLHPRKLPIGAARRRLFRWSSLPSLCATVLGLLSPMLPAGQLARGCFECVGARPQLPARAIREAAASTLLLGISSTQLSEPACTPYVRAPHAHAQQSLALASAATGLVRALQLVGVSGQGMRPLARALLVWTHGGSGASALLWLMRHRRRHRRRARSTQHELALAAAERTGVPTSS